MDLRDLGWSAEWEEAFASDRARGWTPARVVTEDKHHYTVVTGDEAVTGQVSGKLLHESDSPAALPKVGDWVAVSRMEGEAKVIIHRVLPRRTRLSRRIVGRETREQMLVTNVDVGFVVQALDASFSPRLLQRHVAMVLEGGARAVVLLNKLDLCDALDRRVTEARGGVGEVPILPVCAVTGQGTEAMRAFLAPATTAVFIGRSGVGKSSLINQLAGREIQVTNEVREWDAKGRHTTTWRELIPLPCGGLVIDTPGMREFQMWEAEEGLAGTFADIDELAAQCHFRDCTHTSEGRCAVRAAVAEGRIATARFESYLKLRRELDALSAARIRRGYVEKRRRTRVERRVREMRPFDRGD